VVDEKVKKEGEDRARQLNESARQQLQVALREEGEDVEYDVDWELIRRATETPFQPGDLSLATAFQTLGWMEVDDGEKPPLLPIQDGPSLVPEPETPQPPRPLHPSLRPGATMKEIKEEALRRFPVADQRQVGLVLELDDRGDRVYSRALKNYLKVNRISGLVGIRLLPSDLLGISKSHGLSDSETSPGFEEASLGFEAAPTGFGAMDSHCESALDLGPPVLDQTSRENYLSIEEVPRKTLTRGQKKTLDQCRKEVIESDVSMWSTLSGSRHLTPLPKGCKVFLMEVFAGAAVLTSMALNMQLPVATPVDLNLDGTNLLDPKVRNQLDEEIDRHDPYLLTFAPVCSPWGSWSRLNMAKNEETAINIMAERDAWYPCLCWMPDHQAATGKRKKSSPREPMGQ